VGIGGGGVKLETFNLPDVGEGLTEAEILGWRVAVGDTVTINQVLVEIETAKAAVELPSPYAGRVAALLVADGETVDVGTPIITIDTDPSGSTPPAGPPQQATRATDVDTAAEDEVGTKIGEVTADGKVATLVGYATTHVSAARRPRKPGAVPPAGPTASAAPSAPVAPPPSAPPSRPASPTPAAAEPGKSALASPLVRQLAKDLGIDLSMVHATGAEGVITRSDVQQAAIPVRPPASPSGVPEASRHTESTVEQTPRERRVPIKGVRKATAAAMVASKFTAPHVSVFLTVDVTEMMLLRDRLRARPEYKNVKITPLTFAARAVCRAVERTPDVNAYWDEGTQEIVYMSYVNLGIAAATPRGLVVPNIKNANELDLFGLARALTELTDTARAGKTQPAAMAGGTFTITNIGVLGVDTGTPIINRGEAAILALGSIKDAPWVVDGQLAVRKVCQLSLSIDHRVLDGEQGSRFLADVGALMAEPGLALIW
jgi:2-oxoisovalerate dehydrogenase E2 component (dihydrolipoyl transacylase)